MIVRYECWLGRRYLVAGSFELEEREWETEGRVELVKSTMREIRGDGGATKLAAQSQACLVFQERAETSLLSANQGILSV